MRERGPRMHMAGGGALWSPGGSAVNNVVREREIAHG